MPCQDNGIIGIGNFGPRVDVSFAYHPRIVTLETPLAIPTGEPASANVEIEISQNDFYEMIGGAISQITAQKTFGIAAVLFFQRTPTATNREVYIKYLSANPSTYLYVSEADTFWRMHNNLYSSYPYMSVLAFSVCPSNFDVADPDYNKLKFKVFSNAAQEDGCVLTRVGIFIYPMYLGAGGCSVLRDLQIDVDYSPLFEGYSESAYSSPNIYLLPTPYTTGGNGNYAGYRVYRTNVDLPIFAGSDTYGILQISPDGSFANLNMISKTDANAHNIFERPTRIAYTPMNYSPGI